MLKRKKVYEVGPNFRGTTAPVRPPEKKPEALPISVRDAEGSDISFLFNSCLRSFRNGKLNAGVSNSIYFTEHHKVLEKIFKRAKVLVACETADPSNIYGYLCYEIIEGIFVLHYSYVKQPFRRLGVQKALLVAANHNVANPGFYTHENPTALHMAPKLNLIYHPYLLINYDKPSVSIDAQAEPADE